MTLVHLGGFVMIKQLFLQNILVCVWFEITGLFDGHHAEHTYLQTYADRA